MMTMITGAEAVTTIWRQKCQRQGSANQLKSPQHMPNQQTVFLMVSRYLSSSCHTSWSDLTDVWWWLKIVFAQKSLVYWSRSVFLIMWTGSDYDMDNNVASPDIMHRLLSHFSDKQHQSLVWEMMMLWYLRGTLLVIKFSTVSPEY